MVKFFIKINLFILLLLLAFFAPKISRADSEIFRDDFNDGAADGWIVPRLPCSGGPWQIQNNMYGIPNPGCVTESIPSTLSIGPGLSYSFELDMALPDSTSKDRNFVFKYKNSSNWYGVHIYENNVYLQKVVGGVEIGSPFWSGTYPFSANSTYNFKINVYATFIEVRIDGNLIGTVYDSIPTFDNLSAGLQASGSDTVWFDNVVVTQLDVSTPTPSPTPTLTPTPTPTQSPTPTPVPTTGPFDLPFDYPGRPATNPSEFKSGFWNRLTATFDHVFKTGIFRPFTGDSYSSCLSPISCYDSHNGTDFSTLGGAGVYSVAGGTVSYASPHTFNTCTPEKGGYGCVVIIQYPNNTFGLYAHLSKIFVLSDQPVTNSTLIGTMGNTGCPGCGLHLHFGVLKPVGTTALSAVKKMSRKDWQDLIYYAKPAPTQSAKAFCTYKSPSGVSFSFTDVSGWRGIGSDPWSLSKGRGGCGVTSPYLWKFDIDSTP